MKRLFVVIGLMALSAAAGYIIAAGDGREAMMQADRDFNADNAARGLEAWIERFAEDAVVFPSGPIVKGKKTIVGLWKEKHFDPAGLTWKVDGAEIAESGELGFTYGYWSKSDADPKAPPVMTGKYLTVWRKQPDGAWKVIADIGSPDPPSAAPPPPPPPPPKM